ncbi:MAG: ECF transporter S component [Butyrivibrio sp.]|nr:ECF transporter S component [Butyrivibrio sp.]
MNEKQGIFETIAQSWQYFAALIIIVAIAFAVTIAVEKVAVKKEGKQDERLLSVRKMAIVGVFSAVSFVLMLLEFPLPFAPSFYKFDFSDMPALVGGFAAGPFAGVMIEFIKILLKLVIKGTSSGFIGEIANFVVGASFVVPATIIYRLRKTRKTALISCIVGTICITLAGSFLNAFFLLPAYAVIYGCDISMLVEMGTQINPAITSVTTFCLLAVAPFNLIKGIVDSVITFALYKHISPILKGNSQNRNK